MVHSVMPGNRTAIRLVVASCVLCIFNAQASRAAGPLRWDELPAIPDALGVAGPFVGISRDALVVAGGANFPSPVWQNDKAWHDTVYVLQGASAKNWRAAEKLPRPLAYGASATTKLGLVCIGGNDAQQVYQDVFALQWDPISKRLQRTVLPSLPTPHAYGSAAVVDDTIYVVGGQSGLGLASTTADVYSLDLSKQGSDQFAWQRHPPCPGGPRAFHLTLVQHNGFEDCLYVISGRRERDGKPQFLRDVWEYSPRTQMWRPRAFVPQCVMAGTGVAHGQSHVIVFGGASGELFHRTEELKDDHPGFPKQAWMYHTITDTWTSAGTTPANHVTTVAVPWGEHVVIPSGEVRPRVRSPKVLRVRMEPAKRSFGVINYGVLIGYLATVVGVGVYFARANKSTDDYFRGGKRIPWWAAGCSIFATMLSSLTYTGIPSKAYAQDWVYAVGNFTIPVVAVAAVWIALPFFRSLDATSAYEYLEKRFSRPVRLFGSGCFTLFHVFRMAVVMSLTGLALSVATPLTPFQSVLLMGALSVLYCTIGGIEAVIWTDTLQTVVLLGGALIALALLVAGTDGGTATLLQEGHAAEKFRIANLHWGVGASQVALWIVIAGGLAQNLSSYTADQAVVQRYMTTSDTHLAAKSIWTNALLSIPATFLFYGLGSALYVFYRAHPERLDPTITTDQIFPLYIAREMPVGLAGLMVAGIFAAAQSTVSTSMNSMATAVVTDFLRPLDWCSTERGYLTVARWLTGGFGVLGTVIALLFINPEIKSLFDASIKVIGIFMGVLGGLFVLGVLTTRANARGAFCGAMVGACAMIILWQFFDQVSSVIYPAVGVGTCVVAGYLASLASGHGKQDLSGLTLFTRSRAAEAKP